jgi:DNA-binding MurR/RpiR family transcriptional regulator
MAEVAERLGVSRSTVLRMCRSAGIDPVAARREAVTREWWRSLQKAQGRIRRSPSKRELAGVLRSARQRGEE